MPPYEDGRVRHSGSRLILDRGLRSEALFIYHKWLGGRDCEIERS